MREHLCRMGGAGIRAAVGCCRRVGVGEIGSCAHGVKRHACRRHECSRYVYPQGWKPATPAPPSGGLSTTWSVTATWKVELDDRARQELRKLDPSAQREILAYLRRRIAADEDPRRFGKQLRGELAALWRYRVATYRLICSLEDLAITVVALRVGHRRAICAK